MIAAKSVLEELRARSPHNWLRERDVDLLVCAELHAKGALGALLCQSIGHAAAGFDGAWVSHSELDGESDLVAAFSSDKGTVLALIENKIATSFQPDQGKRYAERASRWRKCDGVIEVVTVLLAPGAYLARPGAEFFSVHLSYEDVCDRLAISGDARSAFLADTLLVGVENLRRGYVMTPDALVTDVWRTMWETSLRITPKLNFTEPGFKPGKSTWVYFNEPEGFSVGYGKKVVVAYKAERGQADLQFAATPVSELARASEGILDSSMSLAPAAKSASVRMQVPKVDFTRPGDEQRAEIGEGLLACEHLRLFFVTHRERLLNPLARLEPIAQGVVSEAN